MLHNRSRGCNQCHDLVAMANNPAVSAKAKKEIRLPDNVIKEMEKIGRKFEGNIRKMMRAKRQSAKTDGELKVYTDDKSNEKYPNGTRPFASP